MARYGDDTNRDRWRDEDRERSSWRSSGQGTSERDDERGFFERAGEEVRSWFSDDDQGSGRLSDRDRSRGWSGGSSWDPNRDHGRSGMSRSSGGGWSSSSDRDFGARDREGGHGRTGSDMEARSSFGGMAQGGRSSGSFGREHERGSSRGGDWRLNQPDRSGGYGGHGASRSDREWERGGHAQSWGEANRGQSGGWNRDRERDRDQESFGYGSAMSGTMGGFGNQTFGSSQDDHYRSWRDRQMSELDRDYDDYCREREQQFHSDFDSWRRNRLSRSPSVSTSPSSSDLGAAPNAAVGTTTSSVAGTGGAGSALGSGGSAIGEAARTVGSTPMADATDQTGTADTGVGTGGGRSGSRSRS
ncbi:MAG TPA: hypothetical protein VFZ88_05245 [Sphingomicrobium sp.]